MSKIVDFFKKIKNYPAKMEAQRLEEERQDDEKRTVDFNYRRKLLESPTRLLSAAEKFADAETKDIIKIREEILKKQEAGEKVSRELKQKASLYFDRGHGNILHPEFDDKDIKNSRRFLVRRYVDNVIGNRDVNYVGTDWEWGDYGKMEKKVDKLYLKKHGTTLNATSYSPEELMKPDYDTSYKRLMRKKAVHGANKMNAKTVSIILLIIGISTLAFLLTQIIVNPGITSFFLFH